MKVAVFSTKRYHRESLEGANVSKQHSLRFFEIIRDDVFTRLLTFPNVIITEHQAFFTTNALENIAATTVGNITEFERTDAVKA